MKLIYLLICFCTAFALSSCNQEENEVDLISQWHLIEQLSDPGDGSGTFQPVSSDKTVEFFVDGTITSNGDLCWMGTETGTGSTGTYDSMDSTILPNNCGFAPPYPMTFEIQDGFLIINYPCIEPCREKYEPVD